jgi:hypothetical protein
MLLVSDAKAEREYRDRDAATPKVAEALRDARDLLLVANRDTRKAAGDFGYVIDDSLQAKAKPAPWSSACCPQSYAPPGIRAALSVETV